MIFHNHGRARMMIIKNTLGSIVENVYTKIKRRYGLP
jgi:hypothetical protein